MAIRIKSRGGEHVEGMMKRFKKLCEKEGLTKDIRRKEYYEKPSERRRRAARKSEARRLRPEGVRPEFVDEKNFLPVMAHGLQTMSMGYLSTEKTPLILRGPMVSGALQQLVNQCLWRDLDFLVVDMPPGTGDIPLTLAQKVPVVGAVIVTTPQDIALLDAQKGIEMFRKVDIRILGVVENMAVHICSNCGHAEHIFGEGGGQRIATDYQTELLGALPLDLAIRQQTDSGAPPVVSDPSGKVAGIYRSIARKLLAKVAALGVNPANPAAGIIASDHR